MDTVSMLNKMSFYCQPILPLVYDESMSYYETLCKVVGQLNTTGDAVNKLNEGLTGEIADRQKGDILLDERLRVLEKTNQKIHFLAFAGTPPHSAGLIGTAPTRSELRQWVNNHDLIITLLETTDEERNVVYAASCAYNAGNWADETSDDFNILVPIHTSYDADKDHAISQKVAKITIPPISQTSLDAPWGLQFIEINTPSTSADGVVNFAANIFQDGHMECNLTPFEFMNLYAPTWANRNLCVAVNAKLFYDGYTRTSSIATLNSSNHIIRIAFERDYGVFEKNGVRQLNKEIDYIIGDVSHNTWTHETIDSKTLDFSRYEGFQFTRGAHNVITANDESTPNAVYTQYHSDTSGKIYQNLPVRLVDTVDNAEYWNGVFDIKDGNHMTFTFVTSNYATDSDKMLVRVIELSADVNTTTWKYSEKEFELPITGSFTVDDALSDTSTNPVQNKVVKTALDGKASTAVASRTANGLMSTSDYIKLLGIENGATNTVVDAELKSNSTNPVQNKVVKTALDGKASTAVASQTANGLMSKDDKKKLDGVAEGANKTTLIDAVDPLSHNPVTSAALFEALSSKADRTEATEQSAGLMSALDKKKLNGIEEGANKTIVDEALSDGSTNPVQNKAVTAALSSVVRETIYPITVTATSAEWVVNNGIAYKEASSDRTFDNIKAAYNANKTLVCEFERMTYSLILDSPTAFIFASYRGAVANDSQYAGLGKYPTSLITINTTGVVISRTAGDLPAVGGTDNGKMLIVSGGEWALQSVAGATVDAELSTTSENPVQNKTVTAALNDKLPKTGGTVTGALRTNDSFSAGGTIAFGGAPIVLSQTADGAAEIHSGTADVDDNQPPLARVKVARPTEDDDAATKKYVDDRNNSPQFKGYVTLTPANAPLGTGVGLSPTGSGNDFTLNISDVNEGTPTLLTGVKTPTDADTDAAANVEYVNAKVASGGSADAVLYTAQTLTDEQKKQARDNVDAAIADFSVTATIENFPTCTLDKTFNQIQEAISKGKRVFARLNISSDNAFILELLSSTSTEIQFTAFDYNNVLNKAQAYKLVVSPNKSEIAFGAAPTLTPENTLYQVEMVADPSSDMEIATKKYVDNHAGGGSSVTVDTAMSDTSTNAVQNKVIKKYVDDHSSSSATKVTLTGTIEGEVSGYTSATYQQIVDEIAKSGNIWLTIGGETVRLASWKLSGASTYTLVFFGAGDGALTVKYEVTASASSASLTVTGS